MGSDWARKSNAALPPVICPTPASAATFSWVTCADLKHSRATRVHSRCRQPLNGGKRLPQTPPRTPTIPTAVLTWCYKQAGSCRRPGLPCGSTAAVLSGRYRERVSAGTCLAEYIESRRPGNPSQFKPISQSTVDNLKTAAKHLRAFLRDADNMVRRHTPGSRDCPGLPRFDAVGRNAWPVHGTEMAGTGAGSAGRCGHPGACGSHLWRPGRQRPSVPSCVAMKGVGARPRLNWNGCKTARRRGACTILMWDRSLLSGERRAPPAATVPACPKNHRPAP